MTAWHGKAKDTLPAEANEIIAKFLARKRMQDKYINQVGQASPDLSVTWERQGHKHLSVIWRARHKRACALR